MCTEKTLLSLSFYECEHGGDLRRYRADIVSCGGRIKRTDINIPAEIGRIDFQVKSKKGFWGKFKKTSSYGFIN